MKLVIIEDLQSYLASCDVIDCRHPKIKKKALSLTKQCQTEIEKARLLFEFVRDEISHSFDTQHLNRTWKASDVLIQGHGICFAKSHLLAALLRSIEIPAGFCYQRLRVNKNDPTSILILHGLNAVFLPTNNQWIRLDARGNKAGILAKFSLKIEQLAFPIQEELGEKDHPYVFSKPDPSVISCLSDQECWNWNLKHSQLPMDLSNNP